MTGHQNMTFADYLIAVEYLLDGRWGVTTDQDDREVIAAFYRAARSPEQVLTHSLVFKYGLITHTFDEFCREVDGLLKQKFGITTAEIAQCRIDGAWREEQSPEFFVGWYSADLDLRFALPPEDFDQAPSSTDQGPG